MSQALTKDTALSRWEPMPCVEGLPAARGPVDRLRQHDRATIEPATLPTIQAGQLWLVELSPIEHKIPPLEFRALMAANVVIYDRVFASAVARILPLGGYAEPAPRCEAPSGRTWERALRFACEGWSVVRLVTSEGRVQRIQHLSERLLTAKEPPSLPVSVFANTGSGYERTEAQLDGLGTLIESYDLEQPLALTIVLDAIGAGAAPRFSVVSSNGLAG